MSGNIQEGANRLRYFSFKFFHLTFCKGMCCALNSEVTFKNTLFGNLTREAQDSEVETRKVNASSGLRAGLSLVLDMHSDRASFGTLVDTSSAFSVFIGTPTEFPVLREDKIAIEPGKEHFLRLSGQVGQINGRPKRLRHKSVGYFGFAVSFL